METKMAKDNGKYKNLRIDIEDIPAMINSWGIESPYETVDVTIPSDMKAQTLNYIVRCDDRDAILAVYPSKGGVYTISPNFGKEKEISKMIADYISDNCGVLANSNPYRNGFSIDVSKEDFDVFYALLREYDDISVESERRDAYKFFVKIRSTEYRDSIAISYYNSGKLVIQGKTLELFYRAIEIITQGKEIDRVVNAATKSANITVNSEEILTDMKNSLGEVYDFLPDAHKAIMTMAYMFYRTNITIVGRELRVDYSELFHPASRVMEGFILKLLSDNKVILKDETTVGFYFHNEEAREPLSLKEEYVSKIDNDDISREINKAYKVYHRIRHPYSHSSDKNYTTSVIETRDTADRNFEEIIEVMVRTYCNIRKYK